MWFLVAVAGVVFGREGEVAGGVCVGAGGGGDPRTRARARARSFPPRRSPPNARFKTNFSEPPNPPVLLALVVALSRIRGR
jgi:hypothetical protein